MACGMQGAFEAINPDLPPNAPDAHYCCVFAPQQNWLVSAGVLYTLPKISLVKYTKPDGTPENNVPFRSASFNSTGSGLVGIIRTRVIRYIDLSSLKCQDLVLDEGVHVSHCAFSPDGTWLATAAGVSTGPKTYKGELRSWFFSNGQWKSSVILNHSSPITSCAFTPDGKHLVATSQDGSITLGRLLFTGTRDLQLEVVRTMEHGTKIFSCTFNPSGESLVTTGKDGAVKIWDSNTGQLRQVLQVSPGFVHGSSFKPNGEELATAHADGKVRLWDFKTGTVQGVLELGFAPVTSCDFSSDGQRLVAVDATGRSKMWMK